MIAAQADFAALAARLIARAQSLAGPLAEARRPDWRDARRLWPLFTKG